MTITEIPANSVFRHRGRLYRFDRWVGFAWNDDDTRTFYVDAQPMDTPLKPAGPMRQIKVRDGIHLTVLA